MAGSINRSSLPSTAHLDAADAAHAAAPSAQAHAGAPAAAALTVGSKGADVKALQEKLVKAGIAVAGGADGVFGKGTAAAVAQFQKAHGLTPSGAADAVTLAALDKAVGTKPTTQTGSTGATGGIPAQNLVKGFHLSGDADSYGPKSLTATIGGKTVHLSDDAIKAKSFDGGRYLAWSTPQGAGGFENEGQAIMLYDAKTGKTQKVLSEYFMVEDMQMTKLPDGRDVLLAPMMDGGLGLDRLAVVDPQRGGECAMLQGAKLKSASGGKLVYEQIKVTDDGDFKSLGTKTADLAKLLSQPMIHNKKDMEGLDG